MKTNNRSQTKNRLWQFRKKTGLSLRQVAYLISVKSGSSLSSYERGNYLPSLKSALKLAYIHNRPTRVLFDDLFNDCRREVEGLLINNAVGIPKTFFNHSEYQSNDEFCYLTQILKTRTPTEVESKKIRSHVISLIRETTDTQSDKASSTDL